LAQAGWFDDGFQLDDSWQLSDTDLLCTPTHQVAGNELQSPHPIVLVGTGAFAPVHEGHISMMIQAKDIAQAQGYSVAGGYLVPDHDSYVSNKHNDALSAGERIRLTQSATGASDWLMTDPWAARWVSRAINFTDILARLQAYLRRYIHPGIETWLVFGSDNASFARSFVEQGGCVCVPRGNSEHQLEVFSDPVLSQRPELLLADINSSTQNISSTEIRASVPTGVPSGLAPVPAEGRPHKWYALRNDLWWALQPWLTHVTEDDLRPRHDCFVQKAVKIFEQAFCDQDMSVQLLDHARQQKELLSWEQASINMDVSTSGTHYLQVSRLFALADGQYHHLDLIPRPGFEPLSQQIKHIPPGDYLLVDDDIATGYTMESIRRLLPARARIIGVCPLLQPNEQGQKAWDVVDIRDLLLGAYQSGLVVILPDKSTARAPYMLPYVTGVSRALVSADKDWQLSRQLWQANEDFFRGLPLYVAHADKACQQFLLMAGWRTDSRLYDICAWHGWRMDTCTNLEDLQK
jgi:nicotinic acid mononucleotide adenylyltransferase